MNIKIMLLCSFSLFSMSLNSLTHHIKQDGTGDFITIQAGINAATHSDTVLIYPGTYYENIDFNEKSITVASTYIISSVDSIINQTIIDGGQEWKCVTIDECNDASLIGFTIQNGKCAYGTTYSSSGAGVMVKESNNIALKNNIITNNIASLGGGIAIGDSSVILSSNIICENRAILSAGGGIYLAGNENFNDYFDPINLNSIYNNQAATGSDIYIYHWSHPNEQGETYDIALDTFTVENPENYFIAYDNEYTFSCENYLLEQIDADIFVAPNGDDSNSGLNENEPLQTIAFAQALIKSNAETPNTIHLAPGIYSASINNQFLPLGIKDHVRIIGESSENTVIDGENLLQSIFHSSLHKDDYFPNFYLENVALINGSTDSQAANGSIYFISADATIKKVIIDGSTGYISGSAIHGKDGRYDFSDLIIKNSTGGRPLYFLTVHADNPNATMDIKLENVVIENSSPQVEPYSGSGGAFQLAGHSEIDNGFNAEMINCLAINNNDDFYFQGFGGTSGLHILNNIKVDVINCTFADNHLAASTGATIAATTNAELNLYNSVIYGNDGNAINLFYDSEVNIYNSLIEGGVSNIFNYENSSQINWMTGNLAEFANPEFIGENNDYPFYSLEATSPAIDAGTLDLPAGIELPEYDLAGNPRIYGAGIDMGAYEYQGEPQSAEEDELLIPQTNKISGYPNPFYPQRSARSSSTIFLELAESGQIEFAIYNIKGQKVKGLLDAYSSLGRFELQWDGQDDEGQPVASGTYLIKLSVNQELRQAKKITVLK